jgi:hypothetical protein
MKLAQKISSGNIRNSFAENITCLDVARVR